MQITKLTGTAPLGDAESPRYSIRNLLVVTAAVGCWCGLYQLLPHVAIFVSGIVVAAIVTIWWAHRRLVAKSGMARVATAMLVAVSWFYLYVLSIGPAIVVNGEYSDRNDLMAIYAPVAWLHARTPLQKPLQRYAEMWD